MTEIHPYATLAPDPTTEIVISWVDERDGADGSSQTLDYDGGSESTTGESVPESDAYLYEVELTGLEPDTDYSGTIDGEVSVDWRTVPESISDDDITIVVASDWHIDYGTGDSLDYPESDIPPLEEQDPDIVLIPGDIVSFADEVSEDNSDEWLRLWREHFDILNEDRLRQTLAVPGNHEVGNYDWTGDETESVDPEAGYFQFWFKYPRDLGPGGENYGEITIGDYLQILGLDTHSAYPADVADWMEGALDETVNHVLPIHHSPLLGGGERHPEDLDLQETLRDEWASIFDSSGNISSHFAGHLHVRKRTYPWGVVDEQPDDDFEELPDGYLTEADDNGIIEYGDGYPSDQNPRNEWWLEVSEKSNQFYRLDVSSGSIDVTELDEEGNEYRSTTVVTIGDATIENATF